MSAWKSWDRFDEEAEKEAFAKGFFNVNGLKSYPRNSFPIVVITDTDRILEILRNEE